MWFLQTFCDFRFPLLWPWCINASHNARTGRPWIRARLYVKWQSFKFSKSSSNSNDWAQNEKCIHLYNFSWCSSSLCSTSSLQPQFTDNTAWCWETMLSPLLQNYITFSTKGAQITKFRKTMFSFKYIYMHIIIGTKLCTLISNKEIHKPILGFNDNFRWK